MEDFSFEAELWIWDANQSTSWYFLTLPPDLAADLRMEAGPPRGFGSVRVEVRIGSSVWRTSLFPSAESGSFVLPVKKPVRVTEGLEEGDLVAVVLGLVD